MVEKTYPMTLEEKEKLEKELEELKLVRRPEVVERIKIARSYGDLSLNEGLLVLSCFILTVF